jgi:hypothetical protein
MAVGGAVGFLVLVVALIVYLVPGGDDPNPLDDLAAPSDRTEQTLPASDVEAGEFVEAVLGTTETYWNSVFEEGGLAYPEPRLVLFAAATNSACGDADSKAGPHYCPLDQTIYIDLGFLDELQTRLGASGDFAEAYVIAHEVGHHVQLVLGIMDEVAEQQQRQPESENALSIVLELQADCFAGNWAHSIFQRGDILEPGDIDEGLNAAAAVGDDRIQEQTTGQVNPETWTHGSAQQRVEWFTAGYETGSPAACAP